MATSTVPTVHRRSVGRVATERIKNAGGSSANRRIGIDNLGHAENFAGIVAAGGVIKEFGSVTTHLNALFDFLE